MFSLLTRGARRTALLGLVLVAVLASVAAPASAAPPQAQTQVLESHLGSGARHMRTTATWYPAAGGLPDRLVATTRTWNDVKLTGFTGSVVVLFVDEHGRTVGFSDVKHPLGVDGRWIGRWDRTDVWRMDVRPDQTAGAVGIQIVHSRGHVDRTQEQVARAKAWLEPAASLVTILGG